MPGTTRDADPDPDPDSDRDRETDEYVPPQAAGLPESVGRYRIVRELGSGGYGVVYLGHDDRLHRPVAVKVPHPHLVATAADAAAYLAEARTVAGLEHANIVPVFDSDATERHPCFVVSRYIDGCDLAARLKESSLAVGEAAALVATVAGALHFAHTRGVVHRDVKPANLLLSRDGTPYVGDFGVALREEDVGTGKRYAGTPPYMSPEQARGEGHRVDGRSDVFSLGVVLYELLTGRRPFGGKSRGEIMEAVAELEPRPPRQINFAIPRELERICLRALAKRVGERYTTAADFAADLRHFLTDTGPDSATVTATPHPPPTVPPVSPLPLPPSDTGPVAVVPKGLRAFAREDAEFFLALLPGPRDRGGLPDSLRFWKQWAEAADPLAGGGVGLLYGPSGCGKTSLVRAGLLPRLDRGVTAVYAEASPDDTEPRLLAGLRAQFPRLPTDLGLVDALTALRQGRFLNAGQTVLLVLDQFEQWLHAHPEERVGELAAALRQCDGDRLRCLLLVRDDFWLAVSRFMRVLEVRVEEDRNARLVDLFDRPHARKVLTAFGRAYGRLPDGELPPDARQFLDQAVDGLAESDKVVSVRLALFAQMVKGKEWTPHTLAAVGGAEGVGVTFLEEMFNGPSAPLAHRGHTRAAEAVLAALLPDGTTGIKGAMRSEGELLAASGYADRPAEFAALLHILDADLRLITPTDPAGTPTGSERHYQLTHDYLVPSVREWITRKQRETRRGRAELLLAERAGEWNARPAARRLPTLGEWLAVRLRTRRRDWTTPQRRMMQAGAAHHARRVGLWAGVIVLTAGLLFAGVGELLAGKEADNTRDALTHASPADLTDTLNELAHHRRRVEKGVRDDYDADPPQKVKLPLALALHRWDHDDTTYLRDQLLDANPDWFAVIRHELAEHATGGLTTFLWKEAFDPKVGPARQFRAACALAAYDPHHPDWVKLAKPTVARLLVQNPAEVGAWADHLMPVRGELVDALAAVIADPNGDPTVAKIATDTYATYTTDPARPRPLDAIAAWDPVALAAVTGGVSSTAQPLEQLRRRANAAAGVIACERGAALWPLLKHFPDPTLRSLLIERLAATRTDPKILTDRLLTAERDVSVRRALILALGSYPTDFPLPDVDELPRLYASDPDAGIHGASEWAARRQGREKDLATTTGRRGGFGWFVNGRGMTFSVVEPGDLRLDDDKRTLTVSHRFAVGTTEVTRRQWAALDMPLPKGQTPSDLPVTGVSWYQMAEFCNRLTLADGLGVGNLCYKPNKDNQFADGMEVLDPHGRAGYRLPTPAEWEWSGRAEAVTPWLCGDDNTLLPHYARHVLNSDYRAPRPAPVGQLKPNEAGLFDTHGNVSERSQPWQPPDGLEGRAHSVVKPELLSELARGVIESRWCQVCEHGGRVSFRALDLEFGRVVGGTLTERGAEVGFRVACTVVRK